MKILIADDHTVLRQGLRALLNGVEGWNVCAEANDGLEVVSLAERHTPDLVILDLSMPNLGGIEAIHRLKKLKVNPAVLVLSAREDDESVTGAMEAGANAYVTKCSDSEELSFAIRAVMKGQTYLSPAVCSSMLRPTNERGEKVSPLASLTSREREVMKLLSEGRPNRDVARVLHISPRTVDSHRANILKKLGISSNAELVQVALRHGVIE